MSDFETKILIQQLIGLEFIGGERKRPYLRILVAIFVSVLMVSFLLSLTLGIFLNEQTDFGKIAISVCAVFGFQTFPLIYWNFLVNYERICSLLTDLENIVNKNCE